MNPSFNAPKIIRDLILAVEKGDLAQVQMLLDQNISETPIEKKASVETTDADGNSLMHIAAANGHGEIVRLLCIKGASLDRPNLYGWTPLMQAARYGHEAVVKHLLHRNAKSSLATSMGLTAVTLAIYGGYSKIVDLLLKDSDNGNILLDDSDTVSCFVTPLSVATMYGRDDSLRTLLKMGTPPDQSFKSSEWTALMIAALTGQLPMARLLVEKGSNPNTKNRLNKTALEIATDCGMKEVRGYLDRKTTVKPERVADKGDNIISAVKSGNYEKVSTILDDDSSQANRSSSDGATPLMYASITGQLRMIRLLIHSGADIDATDYESGWTALMQATYYGKTQAAILLIKFGANVHIQAHNGVTAFDMAMLINLNDTTLFRLLAEKVMQEKSESDSRSDESTQLTKAWQSGSGSLLGDVQSQVEKSRPATPQPGGKRTWLSKVKRTMRGMKLTRTFKNSILPNKPINFEETLIAPEDVDTKGEKYDPDENSSVAIADPYVMTNHCSPATHIPADKLSPVVPPFQVNTGVDKQAMTTQRKMSSSKTSMSNSLNSSGESSVSRNVVRPFKFLYSPNSSGRYGGAGASGSPHSSGGAASATRSFTLGHSRRPSAGSQEPHNPYGDRHSDTALTKMPKKRSSKYAPTSGSTDDVQMRGSMSVEQLYSATQRALQQKQETRKPRRRTNSRSESIASSQSTNSTLTPTHSPRSNRKSERSDVSSRSRRSHKSSSSASHRQRETQRLPISEEDELSGILQKLSLEKYHPIFEEQEIDMDAFLTLTHGDLRELGITQELPRQQILQAISQVKDTKQMINTGHLYSERSASSRSSSNAGNHRTNRTTAWSYNDTTPLPHIS